MSSFFKLDSKDLIKGLIVAVVTGVFGALSTTPLDWGLVAHMAIAAGAAYLAKNLLTTEDGKVLGVIKTIK